MKAISTKVVPGKQTLVFILILASILATAGRCATEVSAQIASGRFIDEQAQERLNFGGVVSTRDLSRSTDEKIAQNVNEVALTQPPFIVYSAFWPNLHHTLWAEAWRRRPPSAERPAEIAELPKVNPTADERRAWEAAVSYYDQEIADLHPLFEMSQMRKLLIAAQGELPASGLAPAHRKALAEAAPVFRKYWWPAHDRANRAWVKDALSRISSLSPSVPERLSRLYGTTWFTQSIRVDVVPVAAREGAYTSFDPQPGHITISSSNPVVAGWMAAEIMFHEASHLLVRPMMEAFATELRAQGKNSRDLWHAALFYLTGEIVRQALAARGIAYEPYLYKTGLFVRAWPQLKTPIETYWKPYVNGEVSRDDAIKKIVESIK